MTKEILSVSAPGRICLFGEHQDYFRLPVIAAAVDLRISIKGYPRSDKKFVVALPDIGEKESFSLHNNIPYSKKRDYLKSAVNVLQRNDISFYHGWDCRIKGNIPINSGSASSSALVVAWIKFLLEAAQDDLAANKTEIAELSHATEVEEFNEPGGKMDHYTSALGGILLLRFAPRLTVKKIDAALHPFVLADSSERKKTTDTLGFIKKNVREGLKQIQKSIPDFNLNKGLGEKENAEVEKLPPVSKRLVKGTFMTRDLTRQGEKLFRRKALDQEHFGHLLSRQQHVLREYMQVSTPKIDKMIDTALNAGALGAKINGSGEGGSIFAYTSHDPHKVASALEEISTSVHIVQIDQGVKREISVLSPPERRSS